ncbi:MAG: hypothetical protein B7X40_08295, partial [Cellulomonas sp. 14-74-6]
MNGGPVLLVMLVVLGSVPWCCVGDRVRSVGRGSGVAREHDADAARRRPRDGSGRARRGPVG